MNLKTSRRLRTAADMVRQDSVAADIGCDHGKLTAELLLRERCTKVIATDINLMPLKSAKALIYDLCLEDQVDFYQTDGLNGVPEDSATDIVIAGIGADVIIHIIEDAKWLKKEGIRLILVPATRHALLRTYLAENGFETVKEVAIFEAGQYYTVICADYTGIKNELTTELEELGHIDPSLEEGAEYWKHVLTRCRTIIDGQKASSTPDMEKSKKYEKLAAYITEELKING